MSQTTEALDVQNLGATGCGYTDNRVKSPYQSTHIRNNITAVFHTVNCL